MNEETSLVVREEKKDDPEIVPVWERGYRGWRLGFEDADHGAGSGLDFVSKEPRLHALMTGSRWGPGDEVVSDWVEGKDEPFEKTRKGFYSLRDIEEIVDRFPEADVYGAIIPYGKTFYGREGYRSEKASVEALFRRDLKCYVCQSPAVFWIHNVEKFPVCKRCLSRVKKIMVGGKYVEEEIESVLQRLAGLYEADVVDFPEARRGW